MITSNRLRSSHNPNCYLFMKPTIKSQEVERTLKEVIGADRRTSIRADRCIPKPLGCGQPVTEFKDALSRREFTISGLCQACQDKFFGP